MDEPFYEDRTTPNRLGPELEHARDVLAVGHGRRITLGRATSNFLDAHKREVPQVEQQGRADHAAAADRHAGITI